MKGFFLSLIFWSTSLLQLCFAQQAKLTVDTDTVELGQPLSIRIEQGRFATDQPSTVGTWEVFSQTETTIEVLNFTTGLHRLPVLRYEKVTGGSDTLSSTQLIVVQLPLTVQESESARAIAVPVTIPPSWRDWAPQFAAICGACLWALIWLLATVRQYGPANKLSPPPSAKVQALSQLDRLPKTEPATLVSHAQQVFRTYLAGIGIAEARTTPAAELNLLLEESEIEKDSFREIVSKIGNLDGLRFSGEAISGQDAKNFFELIQRFIDNQPPDSRNLSAEYLVQYGQGASGFSRIISGCLDLFPVWILFSGLLLWPGFVESVSIPTILSEPFITCLAGIAATLLLRTVTAWITVTSHWQATPGMRLMSIAVVGNGRNKALRPLLWLLASMPVFIGHIGVFSRSGHSTVDRFMGQQVRRYPRQTAKQ